MPDTQETKPQVSPYRQALRGIKTILIDAGRTAWSWRRRYLIAVVILLPLIIWCTRFDPQLAGMIRIEGSEPANSLAGELSRIGKTDGMTLLLVAFIFAIGRFFDKPRVVKLAACILLSVIVSGIGVNILRPAFGRARPYSEEAGTFHGPAFGHEFNSFPSGHSSEAWTVATVVSFACPPAAIPACAYAGSMMWARVQRKQHFPMDVMAGALWGIACGLPFAMAARRK
jgi:membrane-associated phospholipid phosphatase